MLLSVVQDVADQDVAYENIMNRPEAQLHMLSQALNITGKVLHGSIHLAHMNTGEHLYQAPLTRLHTAM